MPLKSQPKTRSIRDSVRLLRLAHNSKIFVAVPMGEAGLPARILALREEARWLTRLSPRRPPRRFPWTK